MAMMKWIGAAWEMVMMESWRGSDGDGDGGGD